MLNESLEYRKILPFQTCSMLNKSKPSSYTLQQGGYVDQTLCNKELKMPLMNGLKCQGLSGLDGMVLRGLATSPA